MQTRKATIAKIPKVPSRAYEFILPEPVGESLHRGFEGPRKSPHEPLLRLDHHYCRQFRFSQALGNRNRLESPARVQTHNLSGVNF